jgi:hypothetical protein
MHACVRMHRHIWMAGLAVKEGLKRFLPCSGYRSKGCARIPAMKIGYARVSTDEQNLRPRKGKALGMDAGSETLAAPCAARQLARRVARERPNLFCVCRLGSAPNSEGEGYYAASLMEESSSSGTGRPSFCNGR